MFYFIFICVTSKINLCLDCFIILLHLISSFSLIRSLFVPDVYVSIESIDHILLSSFELNLAWVVNRKLYFYGLILL